MIAIAMNEMRRNVAWTEGKTLAIGVNEPK